MSEIIHVPVTLTVEQADAAIALHVQDGAQAISTGIGYTVEVTGTPYTGSTEVTPTEQEQTLATGGLAMQDDVTVHAIPADYVGSAIPHRGAMDVIVTGPDVSVPAGFFEETAGVSVAAGSVNLPTLIEPAEPTITVDADGTITATVDKTVPVQPGLAPGFVQSADPGSVTVRGTATEHLTTRTSSDLTASGATVTAPAGYYASSASKAVAAGSATTPATTITAAPSIDVNSAGLVIATASATQQVTPTVAAGYIAAGTAGTVSVSGTNTRQLDTQAGTTITPTTEEQTAVPAGTYTTGDVKVSAMPNGYRGALTVVAGQTSTKRTYTLNYNSASSGYFAANTIKNGGVVELTKQTETITPDETGTTVTPTNSVHYIESVTVEPIPDDYVGSAVPQRTSADLTASGATVSAPAGYYASAASKAVASGSEGTPTASKGAVNNHSIAVTPAVTNTAGYIAGGTHTGTAATVTASELVSGTKSITANGTGIDVTDYAAVDVAVPSGGGASNLITGTFTAPAAGTEAKVSLAYTGSGYPVACLIAVEGGSYASGTDFYNALHRYATAQYALTKSNATTTPTYETSGAANQGVVSVIYKNSTTSATSYTRTSAMNANVWSASNANATASTTVRFRSKTSMSVFSSATSGTSYGFLAGTVYRYWIAYSS